MSEGEMNEEWVDRIAEAVVRKLDERDQIDAVATQVLQLLEARERAYAIRRGSAGEGLSAGDNTEAGEGQ